MATQLPFSHISNNQATNSNNKTVIRFAKFPIKHKKKIMCQSEIFRSARFNPQQLTQQKWLAALHEHAPTQRTFLSKILLLRVGQLRRDLVQYRTLYSQCLLQENVILYYDILCNTYRIRAQHSFSRNRPIRLRNSNLSFYYRRPTKD
jgi:hypothetical protein